MVRKQSAIKARFWRAVSALVLRTAYSLSDKFVVLSEQYKNAMKEFAGLRTMDKLVAIANPNSSLPRIPECKENVLLFVGRLALLEKRVDRIIECWRYLSSELPSWSLEIVGDGPDREILERQARGLPRIYFKGSQDPADYYDRAKILLLTSNFEGFPLVLAEAMSACCVPVVLGSFAAAYDIVEDGAGLVIPMPWDPNKYSSAVLWLARNGQELEAMSRRAYVSVEKFSVGRVADDYETLFISLMQVA
jgi:glycosyltransferase involved in cell wall biosynthesis